MTFLCGAEKERHITIDRDFFFVAGHDSYFWKIIELIPPLNCELLKDLFLLLGHEMGVIKARNVKFVLWFRC